MEFETILLAALLMPGCISACSSGVTPKSQDNDSLKIVTTIFPEYDWVMNILGDNPADAEVTMLLDQGVDLHSFQPSAQDILKISDCDLFIYVGGESDEWVEDALQESSNKEMVVINLLETLGDDVKEEEVIEGMEAEEEKEEDEEESLEYDEHVWLSLKNASSLVTGISEALQSIDENNAKTYQTNTEKYIEKLNALDTEYQKAVADASIKTLLFGDRFPFRYLVDDTGSDGMVFAQWSSEYEGRAGFSFGGDFPMLHFVAK